MTKQEARFVLLEFNYLKKQIQSLLDLSEVTGDRDYRERATQLALEARRLPVEWAREIRYTAGAGS